MTVTVTPRDSTPAGGGGEGWEEAHPDLAEFRADRQGDGPQLPERPRSALAGLKARQRAVRASRYVDLRVPGYGDTPDSGPRMFARFRPITPGEIERFRAVHAKVPDDVKIVKVASSMIAAACVGIFTVDDDGRPEEPEEFWPTFTGAKGEALAELLELDLSREPDKTGAIVRELYVDDATVARISTELQSWSLRAEEELHREAPKA